MKITAVDVFPVRQFTYVKITTEDGLYGLGEASLSGRNMAVTHAFDHLTPLLIGQDATLYLVDRIDGVWTDLVGEVPSHGLPLTEAGLHTYDGPDGPTLSTPPGEQSRPPPDPW